MFAILSDDSSFNDKIDIFIACAPIVYMSNSKEEFLHKAADEWKSIYFTTRLLKIYELNDGFLNDLKYFCTKFSDLCDKLYDAIYG